MQQSQRAERHADFVISVKMMKFGGKKCGKSASRGIFARSWVTRVPQHCRVRQEIADRACISRVSLVHLISQVMPNGMSLNLPSIWQVLLRVTL